MEIEKISNSQFPTGTGGRYRSREDFHQLVQQILSLALNAPLKVSSAGASNTSAVSLRNALRNELKRRHKLDQFELVCRSNGNKVYNLYIRRIL